MRNYKTDTFHWVDHTLWGYQVFTIYADTTIPLILVWSELARREQPQQHLRGGELCGDASQGGRDMERPQLWGEGALHL